MTDRNDEQNIIIARQQQRRGLKQDLPQPLRPGELGFAVDSQQLFIGADPTNPASAQYNNASYFETTVNAREHTISIANNQIIAFTVPFIKYSQGEFSGTSTTKQWQPTFARSIIDSSSRPECEHTAADKPVFSTSVTQKTQSTLSAPTTGGSVIYVNGLPSLDDFANIRAEDRVVISTAGGDVTSTVFSVERDTGTGDYVVTLNDVVTANLNDNVSFEYKSIQNYEDGIAFSSTDVIVRKNGVKLYGEANSSITGVPTAEYDYTFSTTSEYFNGVHQLVLRTAPQPSDTITVCYYSNSDIIAALTGNQVSGAISPYKADIPSFYNEFNIPEYRQIDEGSVLLSETTGLGFIGLEDKHIQSVADATGNIETVTGIALGNLIIARNDEVFPTSNCDVEVDTTQYTLEVDPVVANRFSPVLEDSGAYRFNRVMLTSPSQTNRYFHNRHFDVLALNAGLGLLTIELPTVDFDLARNCAVDLGSVSRYPGNGYTGSGTDTVATIKGVSDGVRVNDYVRVIDSAGTNELHDTVFKVIAVRSGQIDVRVTSPYILAGNATPNFTTNHTDLHFANHGSTAADVNSTIQAYAVDHQVATEVSNVFVTAIGLPYSTGTYTIDNANIEANTFFVTNFTMNDAEDMVTSNGGSFHVDIEDSYTGVNVIPCLSVNLTANTSIVEAMATVNRTQVSTKIGLDPEQIFPQLEWVPQSNGDLNRVFLTQDPGYSSVSAGGLEFTLFEDRNTPTLSKFKLLPGVYDRNNNTVRAKLEQWLNQMLQTRDVNLFSSIMLGGSAYKEFPYVEADATSRFYNETIPNKFGQYNLVIDDTYNDVLFCERAEASNFNYLVNSAYYNSTFDRATDDRNGVKGLINIRNNIEIQTREQAGIGATILNFPTTSQSFILRTDGPESTTLTLPADVYNAYVIEYTINSTGSTAIDTYSRVGSILLVGNQSLAQAAVNDRYSSVWNKVDGAPIVEPRFYAEFNGSDVILKLEEQFRDPDNPSPGDTVAHSFDADLLVKFIARRWSSYED